MTLVFNSLDFDRIGRRPFFSFPLPYLLYYFITVTAINMLPTRFVHSKFDLSHTLWLDCRQRKVPPSSVQTSGRDMESD